MFGFGKGKIDIGIQKFQYSPAILSLAMSP